MAREADGALARARALSTGPRCAGQVVSLSYLALAYMGDGGGLRRHCLMRDSCASSSSRLSSESGSRVVVCEIVYDYESRVCVAYRVWRVGQSQ